MNTFVIPSYIADELLVVAGKKEESAAVLRTKIAKSSEGDLRVLVRHLDWIPDGAYVQRSNKEMTIASAGYVPHLKASADQHEVALFLHTHPSGSVTPSKRDEIVNQQLRDTFRQRLDINYYGSVIVSSRAGNLVIGGSIEEDETIYNIDRTFVVGDRLRLLSSTRGERVPSYFDRNIRAFGGDVQHVLGDLKVGVVGCGGTGSAVIEQLARLGVRNFTLIDPDTLSETNVTRVYGSTLSDVGKPKVDVIGDYIQQIMPDITTERIVGSLINEASAKKLSFCDVIFGCTDANAPRLLLSRIATHMLVPVIDCGVLLASSEDGELRGIYGRVTTMVPGAACLLCRGRIDRSRASAELMVTEEQERLAGEGYAPALNGIEPAVVTFTTSVAAMAVSELLERFVHYGTSPVPSELLIRLHDREISTNTVAPTPRHFCDLGSGKIGLGIADPFLEFTWSS